MSNRIDDGGPAFPRAGSEDRTSGDMPDGNSYNRPESGMSLRDWFAGMALQGMLAYSYVNPSSGNYHENCSVEGVAASAYRYADAMIATRGK